MTVTVNLLTVSQAIDEWNRENQHDEWHRPEVYEWESPSEILWDLEAIAYNRSFGPIFDGCTTYAVRIYACGFEDDPMVLIGYEKHPFEGFCLYTAPIEIRKLAPDGLAYTFLEGVAETLTTIIERMD